MKGNQLLKHAAFIGLLGVLIYAVCLLWRFTMSDPAIVQFHMLALKTALPGFQGFELVSIVWGGVLSFVYGFVISVVFHSLHRNCSCDVK